MSQTHLLHLPLLPLIFLSPTSEKQKFTIIFAFFVCLFRSPFSLACFLSACLPAKTRIAQPRDFDAHYAKLEEIETSVKGFMSTQFEYNSYFRRELKEQNSFLAFMNKEVDDMAKEFLALNS